MKNVISYILFLLLLFTGARNSQAQATKIICSGSSIKLLGPTSPGVKWFKDGILIATTKDFVATLPGQYVVVSVNEYGCESDASQPFEVIVSQVPNKPIVEVIQPNCVLATGTITIKNTSENLTYSIDGINYQSGKVFSDLNPGNYNVYAQNEDGCISVPQTVNLIKEAPTGDFTASTTTINFGGSVNFSSTIPGAISYEWDFGDGATSFEANPKHYYYREGTFTTRLKIKTSGGCDFNIIKTNYIKVGPDNSRPNIPVIVTPSGVDNSPVKFFAYPNPFKDKLIISIASELSQSVRIELIDLRGNKVYSKDFTVSPGSNIISLDKLPALAQGVYSLRVSGQGIKNSINLLKI